MALPPPLPNSEFRQTSQNKRQRSLRASFTIAEGIAEAMEPEERERHQNGDNGGWQFITERTPLITAHQTRVELLQPRPVERIVQPLANEPPPPYEVNTKYDYK